MTHITSELLSPKNLSLWLVTTAMIAFSSGYALAGLQAPGSTQASAQAGQTCTSDLPSGKYGHLTFHP